MKRNDVLHTCTKLRNWKDKELKDMIDCHLDSFIRLSGIVELKKDKKFNTKMDELSQAFDSLEDKLFEFHYEARRYYIKILTNACDNVSKKGVNK